MSSIESFRDQALDHFDARTTGSLPVFPNQPGRARRKRRLPACAISRKRQDGSACPPHGRLGLRPRSARLESATPTMLQQIDYMLAKLNWMRAERIWPNGLRYLWTDAFGLVLLVSLYRRLGDPSWLVQAEELVAEVDRVLGRPRMSYSWREANVGKWRVSAL
jgi:hypothetical protein